MSSEPDPPIALSNDQEKRRIAKRRAAQLEEAAVMAEALRVVLQRAGHPHDSITQLVKDLQQAEISALQASYGPIESRRRVRGSGDHPLLDGRQEVSFFLDESGSSHVNAHEKTPFFALAGVAMTAKAVADYQSRADAIKLRFRGTTNVTFHEPHMRHRRESWDFGGLVHLQQEFEAELASLLSETDYVLFAVGIRKNGFECEFRSTGIDPCIPTDVYVAAIMLFLERAVDYVRYLPKRSIGKLVFESQQTNIDLFHQQEFCRICREGTRFMPPHDFQHHLEAGCGFVPKQNSHPTEISDIVSRDIFEWMRDGFTKQPKYWDAYKNKFYVRDDGNRGKCGLKVFPGSDILEVIAAARGEIIEARNK
jgi:hypothetical protein